MKIAVAGAGIAGTTIAWQLAAQGHDVVLYEQAARCGPVGAGILLQPSGQLILKHLGLYEQIKALSPRIDFLHAQHQRGGTLIHLGYQKINQELYGLGVLRNDLFALLYDQCQSTGVDIKSAHRIIGYSEQGNLLHLQTATGQSVEPCELLIVADGSNSELRRFSGLTRSVIEYPDAALWMIGPYAGKRNQLLQIVGRCGRLMGILPVGTDRCSFFWGLKKAEEPQTRLAGLDAWKRQVFEFYPAAEEVIAGVKTIDDLIFASYRSVRMKQVVQGRVVFIGDAAHASSPHLGQGLNLALEDAYCLAECLRVQHDPWRALQGYQQARASTTNFYSRLTATLTPFFQTSNRFLQFGRDLALPVMPHLPFIGKQMALTMAGLKTGWLTQQRK